MNPRDLPVYRQREKILQALQDHRVVVVESPTGSGKTTQLPIILHEAGYGEQGTIGITQPRRIAAVSVSTYIARQLDAHIGGLVGYKMRFDDQTRSETRIKVMTDGILLQELKHDERLSDYSVIMVDEAHERSLNIDFVLGLIKRALAQRSDLRVIVSSATINAEVFQDYFDGCPVVRIETEMYPVQVLYDDPKIEAILDRSRQREMSPRQAREQAHDALVDRCVSVVARVVQDEYPGDILMFLPGEQSIKDVITRLYSLAIHESLYILPLYGRLSKEEQDAVFPPAPPGRRKVVVATNIAETSITIDGITVVIDSGQAKTNFYNPRTFTSALIEGSISRSSAEQRKGRAGRTQPGRCYRLYARANFSARPQYPEDEIYRTDLSEVVLRMAELGIRDFEEFDFISSPGRGNILGAVETLRLLDALDDRHGLSKVGRSMAIFPLLPRHSRIIVEAILRYPEVLDEVLIAVSFLTSNTPFILPPGEEMEARQAHQRYRDDLGDFMNYLHWYNAYQQSGNKAHFCQQNYLDQRTMAEIANVKEQLSEIVSDMGVPIGSGGPPSQFLGAIARGLIQFVCVHTGKGTYQSLTADRIQIHPGSGMFREQPLFIVAGEVVKTSRTYARSVSPLRREWLRSMSSEVYEALRRSQVGRDERRPPRRGEQARGRPENSARDTSSGPSISIGGHSFTVVPFKGKKRMTVLPIDDFLSVVRRGRVKPPANAATLRARVQVGEYELMSGERLSAVLKVAPLLSNDTTVHPEWAGRHSYRIPESIEELVAALGQLTCLVPLKRQGKQLGFLALYSNPDGGTYWLKPNRGFYNAVHESLASLDQLIAELEQVHEELRSPINDAYRRLTGIVSA